MKVSVFTVCMPEFYPEEAVKKLADWGYDGVEWRVTEPPAHGAPVVNFWQGNRATLDPKNIVDEVPKTKALCRKHKLQMPALASYLKYSDLKQLEPIMEAASLMNVPIVRVGMDAFDGKIGYEKLLVKNLKGWEKVVRMGEKYRTRPAAEIHMGNIIPSCSAARRFCDHFSPSEMGVIHDAGNMVYEGFENWLMGLQILGKYLAHVHVKNSSWSVKETGAEGNVVWKPDADTLRGGRVDWGTVISALKKVGYKKFISLEDFSAGSTEDKLKDDLQYLKKLIKSA